MEEAKSIVWVAVQNPEGHVISITSRDGGDVAESYEIVSSFLADHPHLKPFQQYRNLYKDADSVVEEAQNLGGVISADNEDLGLLPYPPKAADRVAGQTFEVEVDEYDKDKDAIRFYKSGSDYPVHTHYLNEYGRKAMEEMFAYDWEEYFPDTEDREETPGGALILRFLTSDKQNKKKNYYVNLVNQRRP